MSQELIKKTVYMPESLSKKIESRAEKERRSFAAMVLVILEAAIKEKS